MSAVEMIPALIDVVTGIQSAAAQSNQTALEKAVGDLSH
jgi:hypothetical protein